MRVTSSVATFNLVVQVVLIAGVFAGSWLVSRRKLRQHCLVMRVLMGVQILLIGVIMAPQLGRYIRNWSGFSRFTVELIVHHVLGLVALALWIYINLAFAGVIKRPHRYTWLMRGALATWIVSLGLGVHLFWYLWR
jgi:hypothetical protein